MSVVYVEARPKGHQEGSPIEDYVVEDHADSVLGTFKTQHEAITWAKQEGHTPHVARVRHMVMTGSSSSLTNLRQTTRALCTQPCFLSGER
jgi:hypothetical protein